MEQQQQAQLSSPTKVEAPATPPAPATATPATATATETATAPEIVTAIDKLRRFCYISKPDEPVYIPSTFDLTVDCSYKVLRELCAQVNEDQLFGCLSAVLDAENGEHLPRRDESLLVLAVYLSTRSDHKQRTLMRAHFPQLVRSDQDLFLFIKYVKQLQSRLNRRTPLSRTVRKAVLEWYNEQPLDRLLHMWSVNNCHVHRELLYICHYRDYKFGADKEAVVRLFSTPDKELIYWPSHLNAVAACKRIIQGIAELRRAPKAPKAVQIVKRLSLSYEHVPRTLLTDSGMAAALLPTMSYEELLQSWPKFTRLLVPHQAAHRDYMRLFFNESKLREANVEPVRFLLQEKRMGKGKIRQAGVNGLSKLNCRNFMHSLHKKSFGLNKPLGLRLHITLNLEHCYLGKALTGRWRAINYLDAVVALAFSYFKCDAQVQVQFWHDKSGELKTLPWTQQMYVEEARACCENQKVVKVRQSLTDILESALLDTMHTYDAFLVLVPCATRGNTRNCSERLCAKLDAYREARNVNAKFIIVSLRQHHGSMSYSSQRNENILELCSLSEQTPRLINAFARAKFF